MAKSPLVVDKIILTGTVETAGGTTLVSQTGVTPGEIALANTHILVGNASAIAVDVAMSGDATLANTGALTIANLAVTAAKTASGTMTRTQMSAPAGSKIESVGPATIATTSNTDGYLIIGETGALTSVDFSGVDALAASDTNYITFTITNLGQAGAGSAVMLAATAANTTKVTGGTALAANTKRLLTLTAVGADLNVTQGDRLLVRAAATGTLANTVTFPKYCLRFSGTT